ncbi:beta-1,6-galactofuranosyltransferase [Muricauda oceani]|uniref:Beta-1,6-galactofuranosyltransferase n=1 Tax=Flagellimonas oceani TaxID=2698672 RepID=A0A6G7J3S7_9FLAO|nr:beta-1,6-galactofuranosyltransferase [Allomuricauda oceani]MBW8243275.1 beta-1,6-galactofuranosyltransferase [Allomuricauda oceani]QII45249.1 beta-1,6-galactofuranosyltransferase [Allomuricauda oceani]
MQHTDLFYISRNYKFSKNAASKPKMDCESVLSQIGFKNLGFKQSNHPSSAIGAIISFLGITKGLILLPFSSTLCMQYPLSKFYTYKVALAKLKRCKIILIVHDVKTLMGKNKDVKKEMKRFNKADVLILHNEVMMKWFAENGYKGKMVPLYLFDYLLASGQSLPKMQDSVEKNVVFAGGLGMEKSAFLYKADELKQKDFTLKLYGNGYQKEKVGANSVLDYQGVFAPDEVLDKMKGNFGLVWNGNAIKECDGDFGKYIQYNNPHKTSLYLLAGLPVIVWDKAAVAKLIEEEQIGFAISSLDELSEKLNNIDAETYSKMVSNVDAIRHKITNGHFLKAAVENALEQLK